MSLQSPSLAGKVVVVTGSGRKNGIGAGIAYAMAREGASVTIHFVSDSTASQAAEVAGEVEELGGKATVVKADLTDQNGAKRVVDATLAAFKTKTIDILGRLLYLQSYSEADIYSQQRRRPLAC